MCETNNRGRAVATLWIWALLGCVACGGSAEESAEEQHEGSQGHVVHWGYSSSDGPDRSRQGSRGKGEANFPIFRDMSGSSPIGARSTLPGSCGSFDSWGIAAP